MSTVWACRYLQMTAGRRLIGSFNHGPWPTRCPKQSVPNWLTPLARWWPCAVLVGARCYDNSLLDMVHGEMLAEGFEPFETDLHNPDLAKLADAYGILGIGVDRHDDVPAAITRALAHSGPALVSIRTAGLAAELPQHLTWAQTKGSPRPPASSCGTVTPTKWSTSSRRASATSVNCPVSEAFVRYTWSAGMTSTRFTTPG
jgi:pyruvate dehydrogenase (quinone)